MNWEERPEIPRNSLVERSLTISLFSIIDIIDLEHVNVQSCLLIVFQYQPISLQYS